MTEKLAYREDALRHDCRPKRGFFLVLVLIVIAVSTLACYSFTELMIAYDESAYLASDVVQARVNVESATEAIRLVLAQPRESRIDIGGINNNPSLFQAITTSLGADGQSPSNYSVIATSLNETGQFGGIRFGLTDESAKLNVNVLTVLESSGAGLMASVLTGEEGEETESIAVSLLMGLPGMTTDVAEAIMDWIDEDEEPRLTGAEADYYNTLATPYEPANGPLQSVEELLLVRGVTPTLLFGADTNRNGVLDADEQQQFAVGIETSGSLGWAAYLTVHGAEVNKRDNGENRVYVNSDDLETLYEDLSAALGDDVYASYIVAYRVGGQTTGGVADTATVNAALGIEGGDDSQGQDTEAQSGGPTVPWSADALNQVDLSAGGGVELTQILDLIGSTVVIGEGDDATTFESPFSEDPISMSLYMPLLMDALTTQDTFVMPGRININEAPAELLYGIPLWTEETVSLILEARAESEGMDDPNRRFETWPLVAGLITLDEMKTLMPLLTGGGDIYRAQIIGYHENGGAFHRNDVIIDATTVNPKVISIKNLSHLGRGFDKNTLGVRGLGMAATAVGTASN